MADLLLRIVGKDDASPAFNQVAGASKRLDASTRTLATTQGRTHRAFSTTAKILTGLATSYAGVKIAQFAKESIQAASDVNEALAATDVVFKKQANTVKAWAKGSAADFGQTRTQALNTARQFGTLFTSAGVGGKKLQTYSTGLTELASDIASFNNVPVQQAIDDLTSGLTGQSEPMRKYGVFLSDNALKAEALSMGISDGTSTLTDQQRTLAAYNVILRQTGVTSDKFAKQFGDFDKTSQGFANQTRILTANWQGFKGAFGQAILPLATGTIKGLNKIIPELSQALTDGNLGKTLASWGPKAEGFFTSLKTNLPEISSIAGDFGDAAGIIGRGLKGAFDAFNNLPDGVRQGIILLGTAAATMKMLNRAAGGGGATMFGQVVESIPHAIMRSAGSAAAAEGVKALLGNRIGTMTIQAGVVNVNGGKVNGGGPGGGVPGKGGAAAGGLSALATAGLTASVLAINAGIILALNEAIKRNFPSTEQWMRVVQDGNKARKGGDSRGNGFSTDTDGGFRDYDDKKGRFREAEAGAKKARVEVDKLSSAIEGATGATTDWGGASKSASLKATLGATSVAGAVRRIPDKKSTKIETKGTDESRTKVAGLGGAIGGLKGKTVKVGENGAASSRGRVTGLGGAIGGLRPKTVKVSEAGASESQGRVKGLGGAIGGLKGKTVSVKADTSQAIQGIGAVSSALANIDGRTANTYIRQNTVKNAAGGGYISGPGGPTDDRIPAALSNGEFVVQASAVRRVGRSFLDQLNAGQITGFKKGTPPDDKASKAKSEGVAKEIKAAKAEAARQAKLAALIDRKNLGAVAESYLGSMSSQAALVTIRGTGKKALKKVAAKANSMTALANRRQNASDVKAASQDRDSARATRRFALLDPTQRKAEIQARLVETDKLASLAKGKEKVRLIQKAADLEQQLADATAEEAQAQEAAAEAAREAAEALEDQSLDKVNELRDAVDGLSGTYRSFAGIASTSVTDVADAQQKLTESNDAVADAQKRLDLAGSDRERAAAAAALTKALQEQATAQQGVSAAGKPTSGGIRANMAAKLQKLRDFASVVTRLKSGGLNAVTLSEIMAMGPEQGYDFAKALLDGGLGDINELQNQITAQSATLGYEQYGLDAASAMATGTAAANAAGLVTNGIVMAPAPVTVSIDGNAIAQALIAYKRQNGGSIPGLAA